MLPTPLIAIALMLVTQAAAAQVYRCNNTYTDEPCKGAKTVDTSPSLSDPRGPQTTVIYLCKVSSSYKYWTPEQCSLEGATIERTERVPSNAPWETQLAIARAQRREANALSTPTRPTYRQAPRANMKAQQCAHLKARIQHLDNEGRRGGDSYTMEWLREERRNAKNAEHKLNC